MDHDSHLPPEINTLLHQLSQQLTSPTSSSGDGSYDSPGTGAVTGFHPHPELYHLQKAREHDAFYRLDLNWQVLRPELRVLLPTQENIAKFHIFLVTLKPSHPLSGLFERMESYHGSPSFEHYREDALWQGLYAVAEMMKRLFWVWREHHEQALDGFPPEIDVQQVL
jgi:hypothetical protein